MKRTKTLVNDLNKAMKALDQLPEKEQDKLPWWISQLIYDWAIKYPVIEKLKPGVHVETGPDNERGPTWFGNDGIDYQTMRVAPA